MSMLSYVEAFIDEAEQRCPSDPKDFGDILPHLRRLGLDDFGSVFWSMPNSRYPRLSQLLPKMASEEVQRNWTGNSGERLLVQSCAFVRSVAFNFTQLTHRPLRGRSILDFGCGYGRLARLMYYFANVDDLVGVDPWDESIRLCHQAGMGDNFLLSDYLPRSLPVGERRFDLIFAFSVLTHLSERTAVLTLSTLADYLRDDGVLAITIRPVEYWYADVHAKEQGLVETQIRSHHSRGFSFLPHRRDFIEGEITYGDTSLSPEWLEHNAPKLRIRALDRSLEDPMQIQVYLSRRG